MKKPRARAGQITEVDLEVSAMQLPTLAKDLQMGESMAHDMRGLKVGMRVKVRSGSATERDRYLKREILGTVLAVEADLPGFGPGVKVHWDGEDRPAAYIDVGQVDPL